MRNSPLHPGRNNDPLSGSGQGHKFSMRQEVSITVCVAERKTKSPGPVWDTVNLAKDLWSQRSVAAEWRGGSFGGGGIRGGGRLFSLLVGDGTSPGGGGAVDFGLCLVHGWRYGKRESGN